jgi:16S rRNA (cytidine1402-2'-O)-methyltransferase
MKTDYGKLYLIPTPLGDYAPSQVLPAPVFEIICGLKTFVVEEVRTARRFLSAAGLKGQIEGLDFHELNEHTNPAEVDKLKALFANGNNVGLLSEAGLPAVADPGALLVDLCHREGIEVIPQVGPSSLMLALMASGLNGQSFAFNGYLPVKPEQRKTALRNLEKKSSQLRQSQIFIETPYRNDALLADILATCSGHTKVCIAADITLPTAFIKTRTVEAWKRDIPQIGKRPCVFIILAK